MHPSRLTTAPGQQAATAVDALDLHRSTDLVNLLDHHIRQVWQENPNTIVIIPP